MTAIKRNNHWLVTLPNGAQGYDKSLTRAILLAIPMMGVNHD